MKVKTVLVLGIAVFLMLFSTKAIFSQTPDASDEGQTTAPVAQPEAQRIWCQVVNIDIYSRLIWVQYFDYEDGQNKTIEIVVSGRTALTNINSLGDIKVGDSLGIDVIINLNGKNIATTISKS